MMGDQRYFGKASDRTLDTAIAQEWDSRLVCTAAILGRPCPLWVKSRHCNGSAECPLYPKSGHCSQASARPIASSLSIRACEYVCEGGRSERPREDTFRRPKTRIGSGPIPASYWLQRLD